MTAREKKPMKIVQKYEQQESKKCNGKLHNNRRRIYINLQHL